MSSVSKQVEGVFKMAGSDSPLKSKDDSIQRAYR
jgi:hypothetical protein